MDPHLALCHAEHATTTGPPCVDCGRPSECNVSTDDGPVCDACHAADTLEWYTDPDTGYLDAITWGGVTVGYVKYADDGEAEGGLAALARFMVGALHPEVTLPDLSPAGWYWHGTVDERGKWTRPDGPYPSSDAARDAARDAFARGKYLTE